MSRLHRYVLRQVVVAAAAVAVGLTVVAWLTQSVQLVDLMVNRGLSFATFLHLTLLLLPTVLVLALPVALFAGVALVYDRLAVDRELVAMRSAGVSQFALARPVFAASAAAVLVGYALTLYLLPASYRTFRDLQFEIRNNYSSFLIREGVFTEIAKGITVYVRKRTPQGEFLGVLVHDGRRPDNPVTAMAERGAVAADEGGPRMTLIEGNRHERRPGGAVSQLRFDRYDFDFGAGGGGPLGRWRGPRERFLDELFFPAEAESGPSRGSLLVEGHDRLAQPLLNAALPLIAATLLLASRRGRRGRSKRIGAAAAILVVIEAAMLGAKSVGVRHPEFALALYLCPLAAIAACLAVLGRGEAGAARRLRLRAAAF